MFPVLVNVDILLTLNTSKNVKKIPVLRTGAGAKIPGAGAASNRTAPKPCVYEPEKNLKSSEIIRGRCGRV